MSFKRSAFSLLELSFIILIIGMLVAGIAKSGQLIAAIKLSTARSLTKSSPVASTKNLVGWWETTSEESFRDAETGDNLAVSVWYDINPQLLNKANTAVTGPTRKPTYRIDDATALPMLSFNGTSNFFTLPNGTVPYGDQNYTFFAVVKSNALCHCGIIGSGNYGATNEANALRYGPTGVIINYWWNIDIYSTAASVATNKTYVVTALYDNTVGRSIYINGGSANSTDSTMGRNSSVATNTIGISNITISGDTVTVAGPVTGIEYFNGFIAEIIIFNRNLTSEERVAIQNYLGKKWSVKVT